VQSQGSSKITAFFHLLELVIYFPVLIVCTKKFNIEGAAFAWTFRVFIDLIVLTFYAQKIMKSEQ
jgi:ABC-type iron transport system FetAB permease component